MDVNNAFTESVLKEKIFIAAPEGVDCPRGKVLRVLRSLYSLKQAARDWHEKLIKALLGIGFRQCTADPCFLIHDERGILLLVYVDDICVAANLIIQVNWFKSSFKRLFKVKDLGEMEKILGVKITRNRSKRMIRMDQTSYLKIVLERIEIEHDKHKPTELLINGYSSLRPAGSDNKRIDPKWYQKGIGSLIYACILTRPDIAFVLGRLSQYLSDPAKHHRQALKNLLRYIRSTIDEGLVFGASGISDSDYAMDSVDRKSILAYVYMFAGGPVSWISRKQKSVATLTTKAEYMALSIYAKEGLWISQLLRDLGLTMFIGDYLKRVSIIEDKAYKAASPTQIKGDNQAVLALVGNKHIHNRSKHIDVNYHNIRDLHERNLITVSFVPSADIVADGLTKPLIKDKHKTFKQQLGITTSRSSAGRLG